jgi:SAM-dependent methyltransferase
MPTLAENKSAWGESYDWPSAGDEWSATWGTTHAQWAGCLYPRVFPFLKGRVDLAAACVDECRSKFKGDPRLHFEVGDGRTIPMVTDTSIDFAFSFDSLVHAEADILKSYVSELARVLKPNAIAFLHHSNLAAERSIWARLKCRWAGIDWAAIADQWRANSMSAKAMREFAERVGMSCVQQELIPWGTGPVLIDCMSIIVNARNRPCTIVKNRRFLTETLMIRRISELERGG